jgi:hypothetical protein
MFEFSFTKFNANAKIRTHVTGSHFGPSPIFAGLEPAPKVGPSTLAAHTWLYLVQLLNSLDQPYKK